MKQHFHGSALVDTLLLCLSFVFEKRLGKFEGV